MSQVLGDTRPFKRCVECGFYDALIFQSIQHPFGKLLSAGEIDNLGRFIIKGIGKQQYFKLWAVAVGIDTALLQIHI